jgi:hypothetical protein
MPKIPEFDSQVTPTGGGVQGGNMFLPNIHQDTGIPAMFATLSSAGKQLEDISMKNISRQVHQQQTIDMANALGAYYQGAADKEVEFSRSFDPNIGEQAKKSLSELRDGIVSTVPENMRPLLAAKLDQLSSHSYKSIIDQFQRRQLALGVVTGKESLGTMANSIIAAENDPSNPDKLASTWGSAKGLATSLETSGIYPPGQANKALMDQVFAKRLGHDMLADPQGTLKILQNPAEALQKYNLGADKLPGAVSHVTEQIHKQQYDTFNKLETSILEAKKTGNGQVPTDQQIIDMANKGKISGTQAKSLSSFANGDESVQNDPETWMKIRDNILYKKADEATIQNQIWTAVRNKTLKVSTGVQELTNLHNLNLKQEPVESESYKRLDKMYKGVLGGSDLMGFDKAENANKYYQGMTAVQNAMDKARKSGTPWTSEDIQTKGMEILKPFIGNALETTTLPGGKTPSKPAAVQVIGAPKTVNEYLALPPDAQKGKVWNDGRGGRYLNGKRIN